MLDDNLAEVKQFMQRLSNDQDLIKKHVPIMYRSIDNSKQVRLDRYVKI